MHRWLELLFATVAGVASVAAALLELWWERRA